MCRSSIVTYFQRLKESPTGVSDWSESERFALDGVPEP